RSRTSPRSGPSWSSASRRSADGRSPGGTGSRRSGWAWYPAWGWVPLGVVTTRQEREVRVHHNVELARDRVAVRDVAGLRVGTHALDDLTRGDGLDLLGGELQRRGNDERVTRGDANPVAVLVRLPSNLLEGS